MPLVLFDVAFDPRSPRVLPVDIRAVPAEPYAGIEDDAGNPGGVTRADIRSEDVRCLGEFDDGSDVYVESDATDDVLDDTDDEAAAASRIWWRGRVLER
jgi:hypothetical protein